MSNKSQVESFCISPLFKTPVKDQLESRTSATDITQSQLSFHKGDGDAQINNEIQSEIQSPSTQRSQMQIHSTPKCGSTSTRSSVSDTEIKRGSMTDSPSLGKFPTKTGQLNISMTPLSEFQEDPEFCVKERCANLSAISDISASPACRDTSSTSVIESGAEDRISSANSSKHISNSASMSNSCQVSHGHGKNTNLVHNKSMDTSGSGTVTSHGINGDDCTISKQGYHETEETQSIPACKPFSQVNNYFNYINYFKGFI